MSIDTQAFSDRLSPRREVGLLAIVLSVVGHVSIGLALAALWVPPELLSSVQRREVVPTDVDVLEEPGSNEPIADVADKDEDAAQAPRGTRVSDEPASPTSAPPAPKAPVAPAGPAPEPETRVSARLVASKPLSSDAAQSSPAPSALASGSATAAPPGDEDGGGGVKRPELPSVMARFTHDLAEWGSGVPAWQTAPIGDAGSIIVAIAVGDDSKIDKLYDPFGSDVSKLPPALVESVKRTKAALVTKMGSRNLVVKFRVGALVSDVPPPEGDALKLSFDSYDAKTKKGGSTFVLGSGRRVTFSVEVLETRALTDTP